ncbi:MAG: NfeD family protein [Desulfobacteraceae bacterium]|jgi:membrane-bound serine protease (ClpP class)
MNNLAFPIILQLVGILVIIVEVIVPTGGILAILSMGLIGGSLFLVFSKASLVTGYIFVVADLIVIPMSIFLGFKLLAKSSAALKRSLSKEDGVQSQSPELEMYMGLEGIAATDLRPSGVAVIEGKRLDVVSRGEYLERSSNVVVIAVTGNQIIVSKKE